MRTLLLVSLALLWAGAAYADEVIIHRDPAPVVVEPAPSTSTTTVEKHGTDCDSKTVHTENDSGASKTVTKEDCD